MSSKTSGPAPRNDGGTPPQRTSVRIHQPGHLAVSSTKWVSSPDTTSCPRRLTVPERTFATEEEFLDGLRRMKTETGTSLRTIEQRTNGRLPRTTAGNILHPDRKVLPARSEQVGLLVTACGGSTMDARLWLDQWGRLRSRQFTPIRPTRPQPVTEVSDAGGAHKARGHQDEGEAAGLPAAGHLAAGGGVVHGAARGVDAARGDVALPLTVL